MNLLVIFVGCLVLSLLITLVHDRFWLRAVRAKDAAIRKRQEQIMKEDCPVDEEMVLRKHDLSWPAIRVMDEFIALPQEHAPRTQDEMFDILEALDVKYQRDGVDQHHGKILNVPAYRSGYFTWGCTCIVDEGEDSCVAFPEYSDILRSITGISDALERQSHALELARVAGTLEGIQSIIQEMRNEASIINHVTKELA